MSYVRRLREEEKEAAPSESRAFAKLIGLRLRQLREALGLDQAGVAQRLGCSQSAYSRAETGRRAITVWELTRLARILKAPLLGFIPPP